MYWSFVSSASMSAIVRPAPELWVADASVVEGQAGSKQLAFTVQSASPVIERVMAEAALPSVTLDVPLGIEIGHGPSWDAAH